MAQATHNRIGSLEAASRLHDKLGDGVFEDHEQVRALARLGLEPPAAELNPHLHAVNWRAEAAPPVLTRSHEPGKDAEEIRAEILARQKETEGLLDEVLKGAGA